MVKLDAPWYSPSVHWSKMKGATQSSDFPGWHWTAWEGTAAFLRVDEGKRAVVMEPVSHEVLIVLGVATIKLCIVKVISHLCFQTTSRNDSFLLLLSFVCLQKQMKADLKGCSQDMTFTTLLLREDSGIQRPLLNVKKRWKGLSQACVHLLFLVSVFH